MYKKVGLKEYREGGNGRCPGLIYYGCVDHSDRD